MKLRWFVSCDKYGRKSEPELNYWDESLDQWEPVPFTEYKAEEEEQVMRTMDS